MYLGKTRIFSGSDRSSHRKCSIKKRCCLRPANLLKKRLWHRCFSLNFVKFLRTPKGHRWTTASAVKLSFSGFKCTTDVTSNTFRKQIVRGMLQWIYYYLGSIVTLFNQMKKQALHGRKTSLTLRIRLVYLLGMLSAAILLSLFVLRVWKFISHQKFI